MLICKSNFKKWMTLTFLWNFEVMHDFQACGRGKLYLNRNKKTNLIKILFKFWFVNKLFSNYKFTGNQTEAF